MLSEKKIRNLRSSSYWKCIQTVNPTMPGLRACHGNVASSASVEFSSQIKLTSKCEPVLTEAQAETEAFFPVFCR